ncbi:hypothetical protein [Nocardia sp. CA-290969]|uniref:hypothetical protein n=1 Tax=Nocardia sp. CA-290969 TaxID=3239986 RepID=UPI003D93185C
MNKILRIPDIKEVLEAANATAPASTEIVPIRDLIGKLDNKIREPLANYLRNCPIIWVSQSEKDPLDPSKGFVMPTGIATDGTWVWRIYWGYFVAEYGVAVPDHFVAHARDQKFEPPVLTPDEIEQVIDQYEQQWPN